MSKKTNVPSRRYTLEFKLEAVRLAQSVGGNQGDDPGACAGAGPESCPMGQIGLDGSDDD